MGLPLDKAGELPDSLQLLQTPIYEGETVWEPPRPYRAKADRQGYNSNSLVGFGEIPLKR